ncbi:MAG TPA: hypothetical protein VH280_25700, partial [Verrucomicrobiae bacterium]|nr:hypothetical protein [Verrucomicrobiae bacterium]
PPPPPAGSVFKLWMSTNLPNWTVLTTTTNYQVQLSNFPPQAFFWIQICTATGQSAGPPQ